VLTRFNSERTSYFRSVPARLARRFRVVRAVAAAVCACAVACSAAWAGASTASAGPVTNPVVFVDSPGTASPPATLGSSSSMTYSMIPFGADSQALDTSTTSVTGPTEALSPAGSQPTGSIGFSSALKHTRIGNQWATWSNGYQGDVYVSSAQSVTITLPASANAFYFYAEPEQFATLSFTATTADGTTSGAVPVAGQAGARYFGFYTTGSAPLQTITVTTTDPYGFAIGEFGIAAPYQFILPTSAITYPSVLSTVHPSPNMAVTVPLGANTPYYAVTSGTVSLTSRCGHGVVLNGDDGVQYTYCQGDSWLVSNGARVAAGTQLGLAGDPDPGQTSLAFSMAYPVGTPRCPENLLTPLYSNAVHGTSATVGNPQDQSTLRSCGR
jgi:hypothetical protein